MSLRVKGQLINDPKQITTLYPVALGKHGFSTVNNYRLIARYQNSTERSHVPFTRCNGNIPYHYRQYQN